ncbi:MAG TPA: aspartate aminotransferase family protein, partial [Verrucomicrobiae bacterium]|nr:aspartate aminotransferase family protein [Verrucomicrobiae bacterium]
PLIGDARGLGLLMGVELVRSRQTMERAGDQAEMLMYHCLTNGLNFKLTMGNIATLTPSLTITQNEMDEALDIFEKGIAYAESNLGA